MYIWGVKMHSRSVNLFLKDYIPLISLFNVTIFFYSIDTETTKGQFRTKQTFQRRERSANLPVHITLSQHFIFFELIADNELGTSFRTIFVRLWPMLFCIYPGFRDKAFFELAKHLSQNEIFILKYCRKFWDIASC